MFNIQPNYADGLIFNRFVEFVYFPTFSRPIGILEGDDTSALKNLPIRATDSPMGVVTLRGDSSDRRYGFAPENAHFRRHGFGAPL